MRVHKDDDLYNRGENLHELTIQREGNDLVIVGVEGAREHAPSLTEITRTILWDLLRRIDGDPEQTGALVNVVRASRSVIAHGLCAVE